MFQKLTYNFNEYRLNNRIVGLYTSFSKVISISNIWVVVILSALFTFNSLNGQANFNAKNTSGCTPLTVNFADASTGAVSWSWDLGNGNTSILQNPSAIYYNSGKYTVKLTITDSKGNKSTFTRTNYITAFKSPKANFDFAPTPICSGKTVFFKDKSTIGDTPITKYSWDMGDGTVVNSQNPSHVYPSKGLFSISLVITDGHGCQDKIQKSNIIKVNPSPVASFTMDSAYDCVVPTWIPFNNKSTGASLKYNWYFGDGTTSNLKNPRHQYNKLGTYSISLKVTDSTGCTDSVYYKDALYLGPIKVDFVPDDSLFCGAGLVIFNNKSTFNGGMKYEWYFGDGTKSSSAYPSHIYSKTGTYSVSLKVQSIFRACSAQITKTKLIRVNPKPNGKIVLDDSFPCTIPFNVNAKYVDTGSVVSIKWYLNAKNGLTSISRSYLGNKNPINFQIGNKSPNDIIAIVTNKYGCTDSVIYHDLQTNLVSIIPVGVFSGCAPFLFSGDMNVSSNRYITGYGWDFGNNDIYDTKQVKKMFYDTGTYTVKAFVKTFKNCTTERTFTIKVGMKTNPQFFTDKKGNICNNTDPVKFINATKYPGFTIDSFIWIFNDSSLNSRSVISKPWGKLPKPYTKSNVVHYYDRDTGWVTPRLVSYHNGCPDTAIQIDSFKVIAAYARIQFSYDVCNTHKLYAINASKAYTRFKWIIDGKVYYTDSVELNPNFIHYAYLKVWDDSTGCWDTVTSNFVNATNLYAQITILDQKLCAPGYAILQLEGVSSNNITWNINGKDTGFGKFKYKFNFDSAGLYKIKVSVKYTKYCIVGNYADFEVGESNLKGSVAYPTTCLPIDITLIDSSYNSSKKHLWILSNGDTVRISSMKMKYTVQNSFKDTLFARLITEGTSICEPSTLLSIPIKGPGFRTRFVWEHSCSTSNLKGYIDKKRLSDVYMFTWDMGDGKKYTTQNINHKYVDSGLYTVTVTVSDGANCFAQQKYQIYFPGVRLKVRVNYSTQGTKCPPLLVNFRDSSYSANVSIRKWLWDFGDNSTSVLQHPSHQYLNPGKYTISLTITDSMGCSISKTFLYLILVPGPDGKFTISPTKGCLPLKVNFSDSVNSQTAFKEWDFGDGTVLKGSIPNHLYNTPGKFLPALVLKDSFGCRRIIKPKDTVFVFDNPHTQYSYSGQCLRDSVLLKSMSSCSDAPIIQSKWNWINDGSFTIGDSLKKKFNSKINRIQFVTKSKNGCSDTLNFQLKLYQPSIEIKTNSGIICLGQPIIGNAIIQTDTGLNQAYWTINSGNKISGTSLNYLPNASNQYRLQYYVEDKLGCWDSANSAIIVKVGDTTIPTSPTWRRVSVLDDITHELVWRKTQSFDFSKYVVYTDNGTGFVPIQWISKPTDTIIQIPNVDALHRSYCYKIGNYNLCNFTQTENTLIKHCTVELKGKSSINASILNWNSYTGWPVKRYVIYRQIDNSNFDSIGQVLGNQLSYIDSSIHCYKTHHYRVKAFENNGLNEYSRSDTCHVLPIYVNKVLPPEMRRATVIRDNYVRVEWQQLLKNKIPLKQFLILGKVNSANVYSKQWTLDAKRDSLVLSDKSIDVDKNFVTYKVMGVDECGDSSQFSLVSQSILLSVTLNSQFFPVLNWNSYTEWKDGVKEYVVERNSGNGFTEINRLSPQDTQFTDALPSLNCLPKLEYRITAHRNKSIGADSIWFNNSVSNIDEPDVRTKVFIPNAFTPNDNNLNEVFKPEGIFIANYSMKIFSRWGEKIYENEGCNFGWDGKFQGQLVPVGAYVYLITVNGTDGRLYPYSGDVTVLR